MRRTTRESDPGLGLFVAGALFGALAAYLFAPESGLESRRRIGGWLHEHGAGGHDLLVKIKKLLHVRTNGVHLANGHGADRRHGRSV